MYIYIYLFIIVILQNQAHHHIGEVLGIVQDHDHVLEIEIEIIRRKVKDLGQDQG